MDWHGSKQSARHESRGGAIRQGSAGRHRDSHGEETRIGAGHDSAPQFSWGRAGHDTTADASTIARKIRGGLNDPAQRSGSVSKSAIVAAIVALIFWSLLAWGAYELVDVLGGWLSANGGALLQGGKDVAGAVGVGKDIVDKVDIQSSTGLLRQLVGAVLVVARPTIIFVWFLGGLAILAAPFVMRRLGRFVRSRH